jgi:HKD family nuclease
MAGKWFNSQAKLVINTDNKVNHVASLLTLIKTACSFDCMSAFASESGLELIYDGLVARLDNGLSARFVLGIDFYQTDPAVLYDLLELSDEYSALELYMSSAESTTIFHPKVYAFENKKGDSSVILGSANLTRGGLSSNHELSAFLTADGADLFNSVSKEINQLIRSGEVVAAKMELIEEYAAQHREYSFHQALGRKRAKLAKPPTVESMDKLKAILDVMKLEPSEENPQISVFEAQVWRRAKDRLEARSKLESIAAAQTLNKSQFLALYEPLVVEHLWHSGGLHRHREKVASKAKLFQEALLMIEQVLDNMPEKFVPEVVFGPLIEKFKDIPQAGINILTEVLHSYDCDNFAIMNQNSVSGLALANIIGFPLRPTKKTVSAEKYVLFCKKCKEVCEALGLKNFSELDALLNYAYWS